MAQILTPGLIESPLFRVYAFYCSILVVKMMVMTFLTGTQRFKNKAFANPEDAKNYNIKIKVDDDVERVRRAHLNDLENIPIFLFISLIYVLTKPPVYVAAQLFRVYTIARIAHTIVYAVVVIPQPARALCFGVGFFITAYMALSSIQYYL